MLDRQRAQEKIRQDQQGHGRPIIGVKHGDQQIVAVGNTVYFSNKWKTFPDFLADYMKQKLDPEWGNVELAKPLADNIVTMRNGQILDSTVEPEAAAE